MLLEQTATRSGAFFEAVRPMADLLSLGEDPGVDKTPHTPQRTSALCAKIYTLVPFRVELGNLPAYEESQAAACCLYSNPYKP